MSIGNLKRVLVCPDKFKYSLTARRICDIFQEELPQQSFACTSLPLADGGEGSLDAIEHSLTLNRMQLLVHDPLFRAVRTHYLFDASAKTAYIEMAKASGLDLLKKAERNPLNASSFGTGELIEHAIVKSQATKIYLFIGGSATNDGGMGMAAALGAHFLNGAGQRIQPIGESLGKVQKIVWNDLKGLIRGRQFIIASDVRNPLTGPNGATMIFSKQKGATPQMQHQLEQGMQHYAGILAKHCNQQIGLVPGSGAAGGLGAGGLAYLAARIEGGIQTIMQILNFKEHLAKNDIVVTGEGKLDRQTLSGKVISGVVSQLQSHPYKKGYIFCGKSELSPQTFGNQIEIIPLMTGDRSEEFCISNGEELLRQAIRESSLLSGPFE